MNPSSGEEDVAWYSLRSEEVLGKLNSNLESGLRITDIPRRLEQYGPNRLPVAGKRGPLTRFLLQFHTTSSSTS